MRRLTHSRFLLCCVKKAFIYGGIIACAGGYNKKINYSIGQWQRGYIRKRLEQKCKERSVEIIEVLGKDISNICSDCGRIGHKKDGTFICGSCGFHIEEKINTARNIVKRGLEGKIIY